MAWRLHGIRSERLPKKTDLEFKAEVQVDCPRYVAKRLILRSAACSMLLALLGRELGHRRDLLRAGLRQVRLPEESVPRVRLRPLWVPAASTAGRRQSRECVNSPH